MNWQLVIIIAYFAVTIFIGVLASRKTKSSDSFVGAGMGVFAIVCVTCGQWLGGTSTTGCSEYGFNAGISGWWYTIANGIGMLMMGLFFAEKYHKYGQVTIPGIIEKVVGPKSRTVCSILLIFVMIAVGLSQMIAAGKLGQSLLGLDFNVSCILFAIIFIVYTMSGGMESVEATNKLHIGFMYFGMILAVILALHEMGGWGSFRATLDAVDAASANAALTDPSVTVTNHFSMFGVGVSKVTSWIVASILSAGAAQASIQPVLAAKDPKVAKKSSLLSVLVILPFGFFTCMLGMSARAMSEMGLLETITDAKLAYTTLIMHFPPVIGGIILASILAAILSTVSPIILAGATMFTKDIYQRSLRPGASDEEITRTARIATAASGVLCCLMAMALVNLSAVLDLVYAAYTLRGVLFIVILFGMFWKYTSERGVCTGVLVTFVCCVAWVAVKIVTGRYPLYIGSFAISETYLGVVLACVTIVLFSRLCPKTEIEKNQ